MKQYSVKKLAALAGVSVRTLHLYDEIGLLKPSVRTEKKYRLYGQAELLRLQQILFYKELEIPLRDIAALLDDPGFDPVKALEEHKKALQQKQERITTLLVTIDKTIHKLKNAVMLTPEELYEGLPKETAESWRNEAIDKWGDAVRNSEKHLMKKTKQEFNELKEAASHCWQKLYALRNEDPTNDKVQQQIAVHHKIIGGFWGAEASAEAYAGLGDLYVADERYTMVDGKAAPEFAAFLQQAMKFYAKSL